MERLIPWLTSLALAFAVVACGGGGDSGSEPSAASRLEAGPQGVLLTGVAQTRALSAQLFDATGTPLAGAVTWTSSDPTVVAVDSAGTVRALAGAGSARVTASFGSLPAVSVLVTVAQPTAGALLLADSQIVAGPTAVDPTAEPAVGNAYEVVLRGAPVLTPGTIVIASEASNVAGRVLSVQPEGADQRVRLVVVPPGQLFTNFDFRDSVDLAQGPFEVPADLAAAYNVVQTGSTFVFTPKPGALVASDRKTAAAAAGTTALLPPFRECKRDPESGQAQPLPLALSAAPSFEVTVDGTVTHEANSAGTRIVVNGAPKFKLNSVLEVKSAFEAKFTCKLTLVTRKFRVPGWAGLFFGGDVELGGGFELGGKVTLVSAKVGGTATLDTRVDATLTCPAAPGSCTLTGSSSAKTELTPVLEAPSLAQVQFEPSISLFGFISLEAGNADIQQLQFKAIELKAGAELAGSLTPEVLQIANLDAATGRSKYALAFKGEVGPGVKLGEFLAYVGLSEVVPLKLGFSLDLGTSPSTLSVLADKARYLPGDRASVTVKLTPASTLFPSGLFYNVHRVVLLRKTGAFSTEVLASQLAADAQADFTLGFDATALIDAGDIFAFVETKALPSGVPTFEMAAAQAADTQKVSVSVQPAAGELLLPLCGGAIFTASVGGATDKSVSVSVAGPAVNTVTVGPAGETIIRLDIPQTAFSGVFRVTATSNADPSVSATTTYEIDTGMVPWGTVGPGQIDVGRSSTGSGYRFNVSNFGSDKDGAYTGATALVGTRLDGAKVTISTSDGLRGTAVFTSSTGVESSPTSVTNDDCIVR